MDDLVRTWNLTTVGVPVIGENAHLSVTACRPAAVTYRQLDYWTRTGLVSASVQEASGSGSQRLYSDADVMHMATIRLLARSGVSMRRVRMVAGSIDWDHPEQYVALIIGQLRHALVTSADELIAFLRSDEVVVAVDVNGIATRIRSGLAAHYKRWAS